MKDGWVRIACAAPQVRVGECAYNAGQIAALAREAAGAGASVLTLPELCLTGSTCGDLFWQGALQQAALAALEQLARDTAALPLLLAVGLPVQAGQRLYNCAALLCGGQILGLVPKGAFSASEWGQQRHFSPAGDVSLTLTLAGQRVPLGRQLFGCRQLPELTVGVLIGDEAYAPAGAADGLAAAGATVLLHLSAAPETVALAEFQRNQAQAISARLFACLAGANAGPGESTTDLVFSGHRLIADCGRISGEGAPFSSGLLLADTDVQRLAGERARAHFPQGEALRQGEFSLPLRELTFLTPPSRLPFVPADGEARARRCEHILTMQQQALATRLSRAGCRGVVVGLSGGLDSTLALMVSARACDQLGWGRDQILAVTMPCFGTTSRTKSNAQKLAEGYGAAFREISIAQAVRQHFADIEQDPETLDAAFENAQARERTQVLMDLANQRDALVVGTGDLSELALGWATYNGDHMSMYSVNASLPKTLIRYLVQYEAGRVEPALGQVLEDVLATPVSPELLPPSDGEIAQKTEELVGPYELHDFFLYYLRRYAFSPRKIFRLACAAFDGVYDPAAIRAWLQLFLRRFFTQQFKRSCSPDGPKVGAVSLSPRGDWVMPSDAWADAWLSQLEE